LIAVEAALDERKQWESEGKHTITPNGCLHQLEWVLTQDDGEENSVRNMGSWNLTDYDS